MQGFGQFLCRSSEPRHGARENGQLAVLREFTNTQGAKNMKAMVYSRYGGPNVVTLAEWPKPAPKDNEVLIRVHATTVSSADWRARSLNMPRGFGLMGRLV